MKLLPYLLPLLTVLLLLVFFLNLPLGRRCVLPGEVPPQGAPCRREDRSRRLSRRDALPLGVLCLCYALTAFFRLGDTAAPQTFVPMEGREVLLELPGDAHVSSLLLYSGVGMGTYSVSASENGLEFEPLLDFEQDHVAVLKWNFLAPSSSQRPRWLRIACTGGSPWLGEVVVRDGDGRAIPLRSDAPELCDEQDCAPERAYYMNSSYFDEIYHARTAWEHLHGVWPYEITHPPLGKIIMGLGISLFGMTPFGWRFSGTLFGLLMLPPLYVLLKKLFGGRWVPALGTLIFATDFMHYVQTRIATIDTYSVFFILLMYLFLYLWLEEDRLWALALCGVSFGLGAAAKWTSIYAGVGLALLWLNRWLQRFVRAPRGGRRGGAEAPAAGVFPAFLKNAGFCVIFFLLVPALIYYFSYLPYGAAEGFSPFSRDYLDMVLHNQEYMFNYHSQSVLGATHPYSSVWYQWLIDYRPILYVLEYPHEGTRMSIAAWLNPVLCWGGLMSLPVLVWAAVRRKDRRALFLLVGYLSELLPWVLISRLTFAYHYFPSALFLALSLGYILALLRENRADWRTPAVALAGGSLLLFILFFPVLNGLEVRTDLAEALLRWLPTWPI